MPAIVLFGHGGRDTGSSTGTYVVPGNVRIHFFEADAQLLNMAGARLLLACLLRNPARIDIVTPQIVETAEPYSTIPNYVMTGDQRAAQVCGVPGTGMFYVGQSAASGPFSPLGTGAKRRLGDLIGGGDPMAAMATDYYWMCCRAAPLDASCREPNVTVSDINIGDRSFAKAREKVARDMGFKPSQVVARGGKWH